MHIRADWNAAKFVRLLNKNPTHCLGTADDNGAILGHLFSKSGGFMNGQMLQIDGGVVTQYLPSPEKKHR